MVIMWLTLLIITGVVYYCGTGQIEAQRLKDW